MQQTAQDTQDTWYGPQEVFSTALPAEPREVLTLLRTIQMAVAVSGLGLTRPQLADRGCPPSDTPGWRLPRRLGAESRVALTEGQAETTIGRFRLRRRRADYQLEFTMYSQGTIERHFAALGAKARAFRIAVRKLMDDHGTEELRRRGSL